MIEVFKQLVEALKISRDQNVDPEYAPIGWNVDRLDEAIQAGLKAIKELESQEPVAWMEPDWAGGTIFRDSEVNKTTDFFHDHTVPLYAHPPQRKPLTDEQAYDLFGVHYNMSVIRNVEAAHGIKE